MRRRAIPDAVRSLRASHRPVAIKRLTGLMGHASLGPPGLLSASILSGL
jgi:hypothetical protein